ncbi:hypothetical protein [Cognatilysobacter tabacisoli]|uniref:hypothetical protein n=1 Tax=Cognatilysobacter tabacisoli TaxID=2315424 RepID=UPI0013004A80|nr:hypothetical protein [Lysobacter tabacisoli]
MKMLVALVVLATSGSPASSDLCTGRASSIAPDMQIQEADLTREAAVQAAELLAVRIREDTLEGEMELGILNAKKVVEGYLLRRHAEHFSSELGPQDPAAEEAREVFCNWLSTEGFLYD